MNLTNDQKNILFHAIQAVNKASKEGYHKEQIVFQNGVILTLEAKSPALTKDKNE